MNGKRFLGLLVCLGVLMPLFATVTFPHYFTSRERARIARTKMNMHRIQLAAEDFSTMAEGWYPGGIRTTVHDIVPYNPNEYCIAGREKPPFPDNALIPCIAFHNPFSYFFEAVTNGRITRGVPGCVFYCAYDQNNVLIGEGEPGLYYEIRGMGRRMPLEFFLTNREQE